MSLKSIAAKVFGRPLAYDPYSHKPVPDRVANIDKVPTWRLELDLEATTAAWSSNKGTKTRLFALHQGKEFLEQALQKRKSLQGIKL